MDNRDPLDIDYLRTQLIANGPYQRIEYFPEVSSTNTELVAAALKSFFYYRELK